MPQKEITITEVKQLNGGAFTVKDNEDTGYFSRDAKLMPAFSAGGVIIITYEHKTGRSGKAYNEITGVTKKGQPSPPEPKQTAPAPKQVEVSGPEQGMTIKLVGDFWIAGKIDDKHRWTLKMFQEIDRVLGTGK